MSRDTIVLGGIILVIAVASGIFIYWRAASMAGPEQLALRDLSVIRREAVGFYALVLPIVVGLISFFVYRYMQSRWPDNTQLGFLLLAVAIALVFTILAAVVFRMRGFAEFTALHVAYVAGFGWIMPVLLTR